MVKLSRTKETKKIMVQADLEDFYLERMPSVYYLMLEGLDLKTMAESRKYLSIDSIEKILLSWELENLALKDIRLLEIYTMSSKASMESSLRAYFKNYKKNSFKYPDNYVKGFFYVDNKWVKKNQNGEVVEILKRPTEQEIADLHVNHKWFKDLRNNHEGILYSYDKALMFEQDLIEESRLEAAKTRKKSRTKKTKKRL